jgi:hypothetical protein
VPPLQDDPIAVAFAERRRIAIVGPIEEEALEPGLIDVEPGKLWIFHPDELPEHFGGVVLE